MQWQVEYSKEEVPNDAFSRVQAEVRFVQYVKS